MRLTDLQNDKRSLHQDLVKERGIINPAYDALEVEDFPNDWIGAPDSETQKSIANFLDRETARIDQLIKKRESFLPASGQDRGRYDRAACRRAGGGACMRISAKTIERLIEIITGNTEKIPYCSGLQLIKFFRDFEERDLYGQGFPSHATYVQEKLRKFNGTETTEKIISAAFDHFGEDGFNSEEEAEAFNRLLVQDGYRLTIEYRAGWMGGDSYVEAGPYFEVQPIVPAAIVPEWLAAISHNAVNEQISKANKRIRAGDFAGAIASSYTLTEHLLNLILREAEVSFNENEGDICALYKLVRDLLNLNPAGESIASPLKPILSGFQNLVSGLYEISNKASNRHARRYNPAAHHAKLAVNAAFSLSESLVWKKLEAQYAGSAEDEFFKQLEKALKQRGTLHVLRSGLKMIPNIRLPSVSSSLPPVSIRTLFGFTKRTS